MDIGKLSSARAEARARFDAGERPRKLLSRGNAKLMKRGDRSEGWFLTGLSLAPSDVSGYEMCAGKTPECSRFCLFATGHAMDHMHSAEVPHNPIWVSRVLRTLWFMEDRPAFMRKLAGEISNLARRHERLAIRLNVFSDRPWEVERVTVTPEMSRRHKLPQGEFRNLMELFPWVQFYDYTKLAKRIRSTRMPENYHLTYSLTENNLATALEVLDAGRNVAVVTAAGLESFHGFPVMDGDRDDFRFMDQDGVAVLLKPKGVLALSGSAFVHTPATPLEDAA